MLRRDEYRREELLLESHPVDRLVDVLRLALLAHAQLLDRTCAGETVGDGGIHVLVLEPALVLIGDVAPLDADRRLVGHDGSHVDHAHVEVHQVVALGRTLVVDEVFILEPGTLADGQTHHDGMRAVGRRAHGLGPEHILRRIDVGGVQAVAQVEREGEFGARRVEKLHGALRRIAGVILERHALDLTAARGEEHLHHVVLHGELLGLRILGFGEQGTHGRNTPFEPLGPGRTVGAVGRPGDRRILRDLGFEGLADRILVGPVGGHFLLITFLVLVQHIVETREDQREHHDRDD